MNCPPCNHNCHQGTECPARYVEDAPLTTPDEISAWIVFGQIALVAMAAACTVVGLIAWLTA